MILRQRKKRPNKKESKEELSKSKEKYVGNIKDTHIYKKKRDLKAESKDKPLQQE